MIDRWIVIFVTIYPANALRIGETLRISDMSDVRSGLPISVKFAGAIERKSTEFLVRRANRCDAFDSIADQCTKRTGTQSESIFIPDMNL